MEDVDTLRQEVLSFAPASEGFESRLSALEDAIRAQEREDTLGAIRHSLNTLRSLVSFLRQEVMECAGPLESLCDELDREVASVVTQAHPEEPI
jgi:Mg2+ and Co2+ transporter CorA